MINNECEPAAHFTMGIISKREKLLIMIPSRSSVLENIPKLPSCFLFSNLSPTQQDSIKKSMCVGESFNEEGSSIFIPFEKTDTFAD